MNVKLLTIAPTQTHRTFEIEISVGTKLDKFLISVDLDQIAAQEIQIVQGNQDFSEFFRFNQKIASDICKLVAQVYNHQEVELPTEIGEFYPSQKRRGEE